MRSTIDVVNHPSVDNSNRSTLVLKCNFKESALLNAGRVRNHNLTHCEPDAMHSLLSPLQPPEPLRGIR